MATERQSPDALLDQTNLTGALSAIQDDPDSPDANWLTYVTNNVDTVCRVSFPTPTGNPTVGADLQQFKIWVRKQPGTGIPTVRIELYENGVSKAVILADTSVTSSTGQLFSATWNANLLGTADGSLVECYIYGAAVRGAPATRCTVEFGAVEWNVVYSAAPLIITPTPVFSLGAIVAPSVVLGSIILTPDVLAAISAIFNPTVILGLLSITPSPSSSIGEKVDPTVEIGGGGETVTPAPIFAISEKVDSIVILGSLSLTPNPASSVSGKAEPTIILGSISITPEACSAIGSKIDPIVILGSISLTPAQASAIQGGADPTVQIGEVDLTITPNPIFVVAGMANPEILYGSVLIVPVPAYALSGVLGATVELGSLTIIPSTLDVIGGRADPTVSIETTMIYVVPEAAETRPSSRQFTYKQASKIHRKYKPI